MKTADATGVIDKGLASVVFEELNKFLTIPIFGGLTQRKKLAKKLRKDPLRVPRYMTDIKSEGTFQSKSDMYSIVELVARQCTDCLETITVNTAFKPGVLSKITRSSKARRFNGNPTTMIIGNTLLSLDKNSEVEDKDKLYNAIADLNDLLIELHPICTNIITNVTRLLELENNLKELERQKIDDTLRLKEVNDMIKTKNNTIARIKAIEKRSLMHPEKNERIRVALEQREEALKEYQALDGRYVTNLSSTVAQIDDTKQAISILKSTIKSDKSDVVEGTMELIQLLELHTGLKPRKKFIYILENQGNW